MSNTDPCLQTINKQSFGLYNAFTQQLSVCLPVQWRPDNIVHLAALSRRDLKLCLVHRHVLLLYVVQPNMDRWGLQTHVPVKGCNRECEVKYMLSN